MLRVHILLPMLDQRNRHDQAWCRIYLVFVINIKLTEAACTIKLRIGNRDNRCNKCDVHACHKWKALVHVVVGNCSFSLVSASCIISIDFF